MGNLDSTEEVSSNHGPEADSSIVKEATKEFERRREQVEFRKLQAMYGFDPNRSMSHQRDTTLISSVRQGRMTAAEFHEKRIMSRIAEKTGGDDGSSCTRGT